MPRLPRFRFFLLTLPLLLLAESLMAHRPAAPQPLYRDPVFDGAADPVVIWNPSTETWWMFYTNRRANVPGLSGVAWVHGTRVSIAESKDRGITWARVGDANIELPADIGGEQPTHWAPDVLTGPDGTHHMYLTVVPGVFEDWRHPRRIVHLTSSDLFNWDYQSALNLSSDRVIDAGVVRRPDGTWRMWYNNERDGKSIYHADSPDLYTWTDQGKTPGVGERPGEGPYIFRWKGSWWMLVDLWKGLGVYRSDDLESWQAQDGDLLNIPGKGTDDGVNGGHPGVAVCGDRAYVFYFTHPGRAGTISPEDGDSLDRRRSSILVTELFVDENGKLTCDRDTPTYIDLVPPAPARAAIDGDPLRLISPAAFAGSSINTPPGFNQSLVSRDGRQYAGFYTPDGHVMIADRPLPDGEWTVTRTRFKAELQDAHNTIALGIDGTGALHLAWGHHNIRLQYARSTGAAPLQFGATSAMVGDRESSVTYPQFLGLPGGDLLCFYRDGGSGRGDFVLNRYDHVSKSWTRMQDTLLDGEGERSAYPALFLDAHGTLHLAWVWRETPDVATNHDLAYARSPDGGRTWSDAHGRPLEVPFTVATDAYAARIPQHRNLMNPPVVAADSAGNPVIVNYWSPMAGAAPQYQLLHHRNGTWIRHTLTRNTIDFILAGWGTKRPPWSRSVVFAHDKGMSVIFRHDAFAGAAVRVTTSDLRAPHADWHMSVLPTGPLNAWEPTADAGALARGHIAFLVQNVTQQDGNDQQAAETAATPISLLEMKL